jgi:hypothetical protein
MDIREHETGKQDLICETLRPYFSHIFSSSMQNGAGGEDNSLIKISTELYENGISCLDLMRFVEESGWWEEEFVVKQMMIFYNVKAEYRCEKLLLFYMLNSFKESKNDM